MVTCNAQWRAPVFCLFVTSSLDAWIEPGYYSASQNFLIFALLLKVFKNTSHRSKLYKVEIESEGEGRNLSIFLIIY